MNTDQRLATSSVGSSAPQPKKPWVFAAAAVLGLLVPGLPFCIFAMQYGSPGAVFARLRGDNLYIQQPNVVLTNIVPGEPARAQYDITNVSAWPMRILGASASCDCATLLEQDIEIPPSKTRSIPFQFAMTSPFEKPVTVNIYLLVEGQDNVAPLSATIFPSRTNSSSPMPSSEL